MGLVAQFSSFFGSFGCQSLEGGRKMEPKCDFDDPYTVFAWFFKHPGVPQGPFLVPFSSLFGFKGVRHSGFLALRWLWPKIGMPLVVEIFVFLQLWASKLGGRRKKGAKV